MGKIKNYLCSAKKELVETILRFPLVFVFMLFTYAFNPIRFSKGYFLELFYVGVYGMGLSFALEIILENLKQKGTRFRLICYGGIVVLVGILYWTSFFERGSAFSLRFFFCSIALSLFAIAVFAHKDRGLFEKNWIVLIINEIKAEFISLCTLLSLSLIVFGVNLVIFRTGAFSKGFKVYKEIFLICFFILNRYMLLSMMPKIGDELKYPKILDNIMKVVIVPATCVLVFIADVLIMKEGILYGWKFNEIIIAVLVSFIVVAMNVSILATVLDIRWVQIIRKVTVVLMVPLVLEILYELCLSYGDVGITAGIYGRMMVCIIALIYTVLVLLRDGKYQNRMFFIMTIICIFAGVGPFSMANMVEKSQHKRMTEIFKKYDMIKDNKLIENKEMSEEDYYKIRECEDSLSVCGLGTPSYYGGASKWYPHFGHGEENLVDETQENIVSVEDDNENEEKLEESVEERKEEKIEEKVE